VNNPGGNNSEQSRYVTEGQGEPRPGEVWGSEAGGVGDRHANMSGLNLDRVGQSEENCYL
jgi:hypothetical protein